MSKLKACNVQIYFPTIPFGQIEEVIINNFQHEFCKVTPSKKFKDAGMVIFAPQGLVSTTLREELKSGLESYSTPYGDLYYLYPGALALLSIECACWQIQSTVEFYFAPATGGELFLVERTLRPSGNSSNLSEWMEKAPWVKETNSEALVNN